MQMYSENFESLLQDEYIDGFIKKKSLVSVYFKNGIRLKGYIKNQDNAYIFLCQGGTQRIFKHRIKVILPEIGCLDWGITGYWY
jgi:RNA chaperone Hfq